MCFSAEASFIVSGALSIIGISAIRQVKTRKDIFVASIPLIFALQQFTEGLLWITLQNPDITHIQTSDWLAGLYGVFIGVIWPVYAPFAIFREETDSQTKRVVASMLLAGVGLAAYTIIGMIHEPIVASIINHSIHYAHKVEGQEIVLGMYLFATCAPFILSSKKLLNLTGMIITLGFFAAFFFYQQTFASVWCFFAAMASGLIYFYVRKSENFKIN
ncbi:MAG: hypothetical protein IPJ05_09610 [Nitrosomonas sp.]|nr:hypothetical protein [Nitrosomonas sp.]